MALSGLIETFKGFFSRSFWFGAFLPVAIVVAIHLGLCAITFPVNRGNALSGLRGSETPDLLLAFAGLVLLAYVLSPFGSLFASFLDGSLMPGWLHDLLRSGRATAWSDTVAAYGRWITAQSAITERRAAVVTDLAVKRAAGNKQRNSDQGLVDAASEAVHAAKKHADENWTRGRRSGSEQLDLAPLESAIAKLGIALESNETKLSSKLDEAQGEVLTLLRRASAENSHRLDTLIRRNPTLDLQDWQPTRLGDVRRQYERYAKDAYGVSFGYLWPRILMSIADGEEDTSKGFPRQVSDAASRSDFAALLLLLLASVPLVWLPLCLMLHCSPWLFAVLGASSPPILLAAYELVLRSEIAFGLITRAAVDRYRLSVFPLLGVARPTNLTNERALWRRLEDVGERDAGVQITYTPIGDA